MADYNINAVTRRVVFSGSAGVGPYAFTFEILAQTDIAVYKNSTKLTLTTDYTVTINANGTGSVTLVVAATGSDTITIIGSRAIERTTDFVTAGDLLASSLNEQLDSQIVMIQQLAEENKRTMKAPAYDPADVADGGTANLTLPAAADRANQVLAFDASGNPIATEEIGEWKGNWAAATTYAKRDIVKDASNSNVYRANTAHTSSGSTPISSNADVAKWDLVIDAAAAGASATAAAASAAAAAASETAAASSETAAAASETAAASSESAAAASQSAAATSATNAASSASSASTSATNAATSATSASSSATSASTSATSASNSATAAATSATAAAASQSAAATSATNAASSASSASTSASNASSSASNAASSASSAASAQAAAESARDSALAAYDNFDDRYLGAKSSDPTLDNDGNALIAGALYFNTTAEIMKIYTGSAWVAAYVSGTDFVPLSGATMTGTLNLPSNGLTVGTNQLLVSGGNVGIGTSSPDTKLNVEVSSTGRTWSPVAGFSDLIVERSTNSGITLASGTTSSGYINFGDTDDENAGIIQYNHSTNAMTFRTGGSGEDMRIDSAGNVGIGTSSPSEKLSVVGKVLASTNETDATAKQGFFGVNHYTNAEQPFLGVHHYSAVSANTLYLGGGSSSGNAATDIRFYTAADTTTVTGTERMRIDGNGNVGIGTSSPSYQLQLSTDSAAKPSTNTWTIASDARIKNVTGEYTKGLDAVCALRPITYKYNGKCGFEDTETENISIIAQEAVNHFPECVGSFKGELDGEETDLLNWNGHALTFALVNAVKELTAKIEILEARVTELEKK